MAGETQTRSRARTVFALAAAMEALGACGSSGDNSAGSSPDASALGPSGGSSSGMMGGSDSSAGSGSSGGSGAPGSSSASGASGGSGSSGSSGRAGSSGGSGSPASSGDSGAGADATGSGSSGTGDSGPAGGSGPCDIYGTGGTPCVAAHSTVRALYGAYGGNIYQVRRASDKTTKDIGVLTPGGFADSAAQDSFCAGTTCTISILYDQSPKGNHLTSAPGGGAVKTPDAEANATALKLTIGGHPVYAVYVNSGTGYRNDKTSGVATGDQPEGLYMVTSGKHYNGGCCFDYGNAETSNNDTGAGHMEAVYFGNCTVWGIGAGNGPWVMADLENGLFSGPNAKLNSGDMSVSSTYVTAMIKGGPGTWAIKAGNAQSANLTTMWNGQRPSGYNPMHKEGAIILGIGGDNSNGAVGTFFEGVMTSGYPSDSTEDAVQANIVSAGYGR